MLLNPLFSQNELNFTHFTIDQGLPQNTVTSISQDSRGFLWLGTFDGLCSFDGYDFKIYRKTGSDSLGLRSNSIFSIFVDSHDRLWIGTLGGGLYVFDDTFDDFVYQDLGLSKDVIRCIYEDSNNTMWIGTNSGLVAYDPETKERIRYQQNINDPYSISENYVNAIAEDSFGNIWIATDSKGLNRFNVKTKIFSNYNYNLYDPEGLPDNEINTLYTIGKDFLWIGTENKGLVKYHLEEGRFEQIAFETDMYNAGSLSHNSVMAIYPSGTNKLWIGTLGGGLSLYDIPCNTFTHYIHDPEQNGSLSKNVVSSIFEDKDGGLWVGTNGGGLNLYNKNMNKFMLFKSKIADENSLSKNSILSIINDRKGNYWIGTDEGGLNYYEPFKHKFTRFINDPADGASLGHHVVTALLEDSRERILIGTSSNGIDIFRPGKKGFEHIRNRSGDPSSLPDNNIFCFFEDSESRIWVGTNGGGLLRLSKDLKKVEVIYRNNPNDYNSISNDYVTDIIEDENRTIWVATWEGLNRLNEEKGTFSRYLHDSKDPLSISSNEVTCLFIDNRKKLWIGTYVGLNLYQTEKDGFTQITEQDGLPNNVICSILEDEKDNLWISTFRGFCRYNYESKQLSGFNKSDGIQGNQFNPRASAVGRDGRMFFGGINGLTAFYPDSINIISTPPKIEYTGFKLFDEYVTVADDNSPLNEPIWNTQSISLKHNQSSFTFEFVAVSFSDATKCQYQYKLDGFDNNWINVSSERIARYVKVPPGEYVFNVKASIDGINWLAGQDIVLTITPPLWMTWWFRTIFILFIVLLAISIHRIRINNIKHQKEVLEKEVTRRTSQVRSQRDEIAQQADSLKNANVKIIQKNIHLEDQKEEIHQHTEQIKKMNNLLKMKYEDVLKNIEEVSKARVMQKRVSYEEFIKIYPDDDACYAMIREIREKNPFLCKKCKSEEYSNLDGHFFRRCKKCGYREPLSNNTIFYRIKFPIVKAFYILYLVSTGRELTVDDLSHLINLRKETCWAFRNKVMTVMKHRKRFKNPKEGWKELIVLPKNFHPTED